MIFNDFFRRWLIPSLLDNCHDSGTFLSLRLLFKTLTVNLGCFPFDDKPLRLTSDSIIHEEIFVVF
jgi:hypothetical protein